MLFKKIADEVIVPEFTPKSGVKVQINDNDPAPQNDAGGGALFNRSLCCDVTIDAMRV